MQTVSPVRVRTAICCCVTAAKRTSHAALGSRLLSRPVLEATPAGLRGRSLPVKKKHKHNDHLNTNSDRVNNDSSRSSTIY